MDIRISHKHRTVRPPAQVFSKCPRCKSDDLYKFEGDVFCFGCEWNSVDLYAAALADAYFIELKKNNSSHPVGTVNEIELAQYEPSVA